MTATGVNAATYMYVGSAATNEIIVLAFDPQNGDLNEIDKIVVPGITKAGGSMPMTLSPGKKILYAGFRGEPQVVAAFEIQAGGKLKHLGNGPLADSMPYIVTDRTGRFLLSASYPGHKVTVNTIGPDGMVGPVKQVLSTPPNAHAIIPDASNRHVLVPSLGSDTLLQFKFDPNTGTLSANEPAGAKVKDKAGPRHFRFTKDEKFVYLLNELDATIYVFPYDGKTGLVGRELQVVNTLPASHQGKIWAADIQITRDGKYLYTSERTTSTLAAFKIDPATAMLTAVGSYPTETQPRAFAIDPSGKYLYVAGEKSDSMTSYAIDPATGALAKLKQYPMGKNPNWIEIVQQP